MNMMKQWLAVMIILVIEWADVGTSTEVQVEQKDGPEDLMEQYYGDSWATPVDNTKWAELDAERVVDGKGGYWFGKKKKTCSQVKKGPQREKCIEKKRSCGGTLTGLSGTITSPGFPKKYTNNLDCTWEIRPAGVAGNKAIVKFTVESFGLERDWTSFLGTHRKVCISDYVEFREVDGSVISRNCGDKIPGPVETRGLGASVKFHSDKTRQDKGFKMKYEVLD